MEPDETLEQRVHVNINSNCELKPRTVGRRPLEEIEWFNKSSGEVQIHLPNIFVPPVTNPLVIPANGSSTLRIDSAAPTGCHKYEVRGDHCPKIAPRVGTINVED
jgi:hypothetical protein